ncbi:unnamed protein product, partial [Rotaria sp. Silwood1]
MEMIKSIPGTIAVYPVYSVPGPKPLTKYIQFKSRENNPTAPVIAHDLTGVDKIHEQLKNFGNGVRVAVIDTGVDYNHPALGGCFGPGCKVAFGYDLVGDNFNSLNRTQVEDKDPIDNCSDSAHGTHVAGIVAANATGINVTGFVPFQSFVGVAPQAIIGAFTMSVGGRGAYRDSSDVEAARRVSEQGVYVTFSFGNAGRQGLQTGGSPSISSGAIAVASLDNPRAPSLYLITSNEEKIFYLPGSAFGGWKSIVQSMIVPTGGTPSVFSSLGLTGDLLFKPQISGIGGYVYSTVSSFTAKNQNLSDAYAIKSGTSMATPYVAGTLALYLAHIGNPPPWTVNGTCQPNCRPSFTKIVNLLQSNAMPVNISNTILANTAQQGAGLVNALQLIQATTIISPSELALNDSVRQASSYTIQVNNIGNQTVTYNINHYGAALATGLQRGNDMLLTQPLYSADYAIVDIQPSTMRLAPTQTGTVTLRFQPPRNADSALLPIFSGFIRFTNDVNEQIAQIP